MPVFSSDAFRSFVLNHNIVGFFEQPITLKSGRTSNWYVNWRNAFADVKLTDIVSDHVLDFVADLVAAGECAAPDTFMGVPEGATKLGLLTQYKHALRSPAYSEGSHVFAMGRAKPKSHGVPSDRFFVGTPQGRTVLLEDTTTTGGSMLDFLDQLLEADIEVVACVGLTNRMEKRDDGKTVSEAVALRSSPSGNTVRYFHLSSALDLLPEAARRCSLMTEIRTAVMDEFRKYGMTAPEL